jgi:hypothetical protein
VTAAASVESQRVCRSASRRGGSRTNKCPSGYRPFALSLLGRHVAGRSHDDMPSRNAFIVARFRQAEIQNLDSGFRDHDVRRLEIVVNDAFAVRFGQRS